MITGNQDNLSVMEKGKKCKHYQPQQNYYNLSIILDKGMFLAAKCYPY